MASFTTYFTFYLSIYFSSCTWKIPNAELNRSDDTLATATGSLTTRTNSGICLPVEMYTHVKRCWHNPPSVATAQSENKCTMAHLPLLDDFRALMTRCCCETVCCRPLPLGLRSSHLEYFHHYRYTHGYINVCVYARPAVMRLNNASRLRLLNLVS